MWHLYEMFIYEIFIIENGIYTVLLTREQSSASHDLISFK